MGQNHFKDRPALELSRWPTESPSVVLVCKTIVGERLSRDILNKEPY